MKSMILAEANVIFLEHFGIKGMKWGVRRRRSSGGSNQKSSKLSRVKKKLNIKNWDDLDDRGKQKRVAKIVAGLVVADYTQSFLRVNAGYFKYKAKGGLYKTAVKAKAHGDKKRAASATKKRADEAIKITAEAIDYLDLKFKN